MVDPLTGKSFASSREKYQAACKDTGILMAFAAMNEFLETYYTSPDENKLLEDTQALMLSWASAASSETLSAGERLKFSEAFAFMVSEIGLRPGLLRLAPDYRIRRAFLLATPQAARDEAARIQALLIKILR